jgi:hypothetical protein
MVNSFHQKSATIRCIPPNPRIGERAKLHYSTGSLWAKVIIDGRDRKWVRGEGSIDLCAADEEPIGIQVIDAEGALVTETTITPVVIIPRLELLDLKPSVSYAQSSMKIKGAASDAERVSLFWKQKDHTDWNSLHGHKNGSFEFEIGIPPYPTEIQIRLLLKSPDADVAASAQVQEKHTVTIVHPDPVIGLSCDADVAPREARVNCSIQCRWVASAVIEFQGRCKRLIPDANHRLSLIVPLDTRRVGTNSVLLHMVGLNGQKLQATRELTITPREASLMTRVLDGGNIEFAANGGCSDLQLRIPATQTVIPIAETRGVIHHAFMTRVEALLTYTDDEGVFHSQPIVLQRFIRSSLLTGSSAGASNL